MYGETNGCCPPCPPRATESRSPRPATAWYTRRAQRPTGATILVTQDLPAGEYTLEHTLADGVGPFCELKSTDGRIDLFSHGTVKATLPAGDYQMLVSVSPGKTVDATITPILRKLN